MHQMVASQQQIDRWHGEHREQRRGDPPPTICAAIRHMISDAMPAPIMAGTRLLLRRTTSSTLLEGYHIRLHQSFPPGHHHPPQRAQPPTRPKNKGKRRSGDRQGQSSAHSVVTVAEQHANGKASRAEHKNSEQAGLGHESHQHGQVLRRSSRFRQGVGRFVCRG